MIGELHEWWLAHRNGDIPDRSRLDPVDFTHLLPSILLSEIVHQPFRVRFRLVGTKVVEAMGLDITGQFLDELISPEREPWLEHYRLSYRAQAPVFGTTSLISTMGARFPYEFGIFPLRSWQSQHRPVCRYRGLFRLLHLVCRTRRMATSRREAGPQRRV